MDPHTMQTRQTLHRLRIAILLALIALTSTSLIAQNFNDAHPVDATHFGESITLGPNWRFAPGDNPAWASPTFDDSKWITVSAKKELYDYGIRNIPCAWYRLHVHLAPGARDLTVATERIRGSYEIFANGQRIGAIGRMQGLTFLIQSRMVAFAVPQNLLNPSGDLVLAIRFALNPNGNEGKGTSTPIYPQSGIYLLSAGAASRDISYAFAHRTWHYLVLASYSSLIGLVALALYATLRDQKEYLAAAAYLLSTGCLFFMDVWLISADGTPTNVWVDFIFFATSNFAYIEFIRLVLGARRTRLLLLLEIAVTLCGFASPLAGYGFAHFFYFGFVAFYAPILIVHLVLITLLVKAWRAGNLEARILLPAVICGGFYRFWSFFDYLVFYLGLTQHINLLPTFHAGSYELPLGNICDFIFLTAILIFLVLRTVGIARRHAKAASELEAARTVQQVLIPDEIPVIPGFVLHSTYKPAGQVGGDFFQFLPVNGGGVLIVIGDVSGKGMPAAMTVSLLVGTVRTLAHYTQSPAEILTAMNHRMMARSGGGFTTCLVLRADPGGKLTVANAGHISPYVAGKELPVENNLPLGLAADSVYIESSFQLAEGEQLTLFTDGVVEARDKAGKLFGFDRAAAISSQSAYQIATAAELFGQDDDITALTLARTA
jgi:sigma-B regulation protein RsbU (phosphoserine phosphatase)